MGIHDNWEVYKRNPYYNRYHLRDLDCVRVLPQQIFGCKQGDYPGNAARLQICGKKLL